MIFHENRLPADDSHAKSYLIFSENKERCRKICGSAAVVISALRVKFKKILIWDYDDKMTREVIFARSEVDTHWLPVVRMMMLTLETFHFHRIPLCNR